jgi:hypothetical protein
MASATTIIRTLLMSISLTYFDAKDGLRGSVDEKSRLHSQPQNRFGHRRVVGQSETDPLLKN